MSAATPLRSSGNAPGDAPGIVAGRSRRAHRTAIGCAVLAALALALVLVSLSVGTTVYSPVDVVRVILGDTVPGASFTVGTLRLPRTITAVLVGTGFGYSAERRVRQAAVVQGLIGSVRDIRRIGSAALDLASVASGSLNAYFERGLQPWDLAAGALIVEEAGGDVRGWNGAPASSDFLLAAAPALADELTTLLAPLRPHEV